MKTVIIGAAPNWAIVESVLSDEWEHLRFAYSPIIAWAISDGDEQVTPITIYGRVDTWYFFIKDPDGMYWKHDESMPKEGAAELARKWAKDRKEKFDSTGKKTVAPG